MRDLLDAVASGTITPEEAEQRLAGYVTGDVGRFDATREDRRGIPEGILAEGKTPAETASLASLSLRTTGSAIVTRMSDAHEDAIVERLTDAYPDAQVEIDPRARTLVAHGVKYDRPELDASIGVISAGTADAAAAGEAAVVAREVGATVDRIDDVGVANLTRITDRLPALRDHDVLIVAAGREGALPTVVAGLVDTPVIGLPVSSGYGHGGDGEAALAGMLQSCTALSVVNIDAGFVAGAQAGLIARTIDAARTSGESV